MHCFFFSLPPLVSSFTLPWTIARFVDPFYTFSPAHLRVIRDFILPLPPPLNAYASSFLIHSHVTYVTPCHARGHLLSHSHSCLGKQRISLGVIGILSMHLCLRTQFAYHQKVYIGRFYLRLSSATICEKCALREV